MIPKKSRSHLYLQIFALGIFWGRVSRYATTPLIVALYVVHDDITMFRPWSPIATGNNLNHAKKIPNVAHKIGTIDVFDLYTGISGPTLPRASSCPNLRE